MESRFRPCSAGLAVALGLGVLLVPCRALAQDGFSLEARAGVVVSTPLVEGAAALPADPTRGQAFEAVPAVAPLLVVAGRTGLKEGLALEVSAGWTFGRLEGRQGRETWEAGDLGVGHAVVALRRRLGERFHVRGGIGVIGYRSDSGVFGGTNRVQPLLEVGGGAGVALGGARVSVTALGQAHPFGSVALRDGLGSGTRGVDGMVYRFALQVGVTLMEGVR
ncbi:MAG TPA: hypothetical protein VF192_11010 [Longimicrobiales bacterium]